MKALITFYSRTGNTEVVGRIIGSLMISYGVEVDYEKIKPLREESFLKSGYMALRGKEVPILNTNFDVSGYDLIIIGTPVWAGRTSPPINSYIEDIIGMEGKIVALFTTSIQRGGKNAIKSIASSIENKGGKFTGGIELSKKDFLSDTTIRLKVKDFVKSIAIGKGTHLLF